MNFDEAVQKHADWKIKFRTAIAKQETLDAVTIAKDNCCQVGEWLYGKGKTQCASTPEFQKALAQHKEFHAQAGKVAKLINDKKYGEAERAIGSGTPYSSASNAVGVALMGLKKVAVC